MKHLKKILVCLILFGWYTTKAQSFSFPDSIDDVENLIAQYVENNKNSIELDTYIFSESEEAELNPSTLNRLNNKRITNKLRADFFKKNPTYRKLYESGAIRSQGGCVNPGFESGATDYNFFLHDYNAPNSNFNGCGTVVNTGIPIVAANNDPNADVSIVNPGLDPFLQNFNIDLNTTNNGNRAVRLNAPISGRDIVTMTKNVNITSDVFVFNFAFVMQNPDHFDIEQPFFQVRIFDDVNDMVYERCILSNAADCIFESANPNSTLLYTDWSCFNIDTEELIGQNVRIEWSIADCGQGAHFSYVYIDDVCDSVCTTPLFGVVDLNEIDGTCPEFPLEVCGTYIPPLVGTNQEGNLTNITLMLNNGSGPVPLSISPTILTNSTFCFQIPESAVDMTSDYEISVNLDFEMNCNPSPYIYSISDSSTNAGPDISFANFEVNIGPDIEECVDTPITIGTIPIPNATYQWFLNNNIIVGEINPTITVITGGQYKIKVTINDCTVSDDIIVTLNPLPVPGIPDDLEVCDENPADGFAQFDLSLRINQIKNGQSGSTVSFHRFEYQAIANTNSLGDPYTNQIAWGETIYARLEFSQTGCFDVVPLNLVVEYCCEYIACPDLEITKTITSPQGLSVNAGEYITYEICVFNNEDIYSCDDDFSIRDDFDISRLDLSTFMVTNITPTIQDISIVTANDNIKFFFITGLPGQEEVCITFKIQVRCEAPAGKLTNCAVVNKSLSCEDTSCTAIDVVTLPSEWPRTYGGSANAKRYAVDSTVGECGEVYTLGMLKSGDISHEDPNFTATGQGYIMKHDYSGNLLWTEYISYVSEESRIEFGGGKIVALLTDNLYQNIIITSFDVNGNQHDTYNVGPANYNNHEMVFSLNQRSGDIYFGGIYGQNYSTADFNIVGSIEDPSASIFKFRNHPTGILYIDHMTIIDDPTQNDLGQADIRLYDMTYAEDINKLYVNGHVTSGDIIFPDGSVHGASLGSNSFIISFDAGGGGIPLTPDETRFTYSDQIKHIDFNNSLNRLYLLHTNRMLWVDPETLGSSTYIGTLSPVYGDVIEFEINQESGNIYGISNIESDAPNDQSSDGNVWKFTANSGPTWIKSVNDIRSWDIVAGQADHAIICGNYYNNTYFDSSNLSQYIQTYGSILPDVFIARIKDNGAGGIFKMPLTKVPLKYSIYPNPSKGQIQIASVDKQIDFVETVIITDFYGHQLFQASKFDLDRMINLGSNLSDGLYFVQIISESGEIEIHKLIINVK